MALDAPGQRHVLAVFDLDFRLALDLVLLPGRPTGMRATPTIAIAEQAA